VEDIVTGLSRIKWLFVIARNSSFVYKGRAVDVRQAGRELGVRYLVEGGVRKSGSRLRVTAQLVEAETGAHLWADKFDGELKDVFDFQDRITDSVVGHRRAERAEIGNRTIAPQTPREPWRIRPLPARLAPNGNNLSGRRPCRSRASA
jgi:hypothetical protein